MPRDLPLVLHTMAADLAEQALDAMFDDQFAENGTFITRLIKGRPYVYYQGYRPGHADGAKRSSIYVGSADDQAIAERVQRFQRLKTGRRATGQIVNALVSMGLPRPPVAMGRVIEALAKGGVFRLRGVLVGTAAYQTYPALLGQMLDQTAAITQDVDIAQFRSISIAVEDESAPIVDMLSRVDPTFRPVPHVSGAAASTAWRNDSGFRVDILTPNRASDDLTGKPMQLPALPGAAGEPLRFLDYLIYQPLRGIVLHGPGIAVNVPQPARYAAHKLIIAGRRLTDAAGQAKARKDIVQAGELIQALAAISQHDVLRDALEEACGRGPAWREGIAGGTSRLTPAARDIVEAVSTLGG
jgi:hypothetical protein